MNVCSRKMHETKQSHSARLLGNIVRRWERRMTKPLRQIFGRCSVGVHHPAYIPRDWLTNISESCESCRILPSGRLISETGPSSSLLNSLLYSFIGVLLKHFPGEQEKCLPTRTMFASCVRQSISRARNILWAESSHRTRTASVSSHIKQEPTSTRIGATKLLLVLAPSIYIGGQLGKNLAEFLDEWSIFYPECDDDEDDWEDLKDR